MIETVERLVGPALLVVLLGLLALERLGSLGRRPAPSPARWFGNLSLFALNGALGGAVFPVSLAMLAAGAAGTGLLGTVALPPMLAWLTGFLVLDLLSYALHRLAHANALLWRLHRVHHSDVQMDVTTTVRHHPLESLLITGASAAVVVALGLPWTSVAAYGLVALTVSAWVHANLRAPARLEAALGRVLVTPGMHALHHSALRVQTDSNYGMVLSVWDRLFRSFTDPARAQPRSLGLEYFRAPADNTLVGLLLRQPLARTPAGHEAATPPPPDARAEPEPPSVPLDASWRRALRELAIGLALLGVAMAPTAASLASQWTQVEAYRYAWLVLPTLLYALGWHWREAVLATRPRPAPAGIAVVAGAAVLWGAAQLLNVDIGRQFAMVLMASGVVLAALGTDFVRRWWPALGLLLFLLPSGDVLQPVLRRVAAEGLQLTLRALGFEVVADGPLLAVGANRYFVADACSGLAYVTLLTFLGYAFGVTMYRSFRRVAALALAGALLGVLGNLVRMTAIVLVDHWRGSQMDLAGHGHVQWLVLLVAVGLMLVVVARAPVEAPGAEVAEAADRDDRRAAATPWYRSAAPVAGLAGIAIAGVAVMAGTGALDARALAPDALPRELAGWAQQAGPDDDATAGPDLPAHLAWHYARDARHLTIDVVQARRRSDKLGGRAVAPPDTEGWQDIRRRTMGACSAGGCVDVVHETWRRSARAPLRHVYFTFTVGDATTASPLRLRALSARAMLTRRPAVPRLIAITVDGEALPQHDVHALLIAANERLRDTDGPERPTRRPGPGP